MVAFEAETYLRLLGERLLDDPGGPHDGRLLPLRGAAAALVAAGAIAAGQAWWVIDDYRTATNLRSGEPRFLHFGPPSFRGKAESLTSRRWMVIDQEIPIALDQLILRDLGITPEGSILRYRRHRRGPRDARQLARAYAPPHRFPVGGAAPEIVDSDGNRLRVRVGDRGTDGGDYWVRELELRGTIAPNATWLEVDGTRVELYRRRARWEARIEALEDQDPVERFLWRELAVIDSGSGLITDLEPGIQALLAAGRLDAGSAVVKDLRAVATQMPRSPLAYQPPRPRRSVRGLVEPWRSLLGRVGQDDGPEWTLVLDALTPLCDGVQIAAHWITSDRAGFELSFEVTPHVLGTGALGEPPVTWWARDDQNNHYLGAPAGWYLSGDAAAQGTMRYWPALDARAKRLDLVVCVDSQQAVISIALDEHRADGT